MRDKILTFCRSIFTHGDTVFCAVSGGADSIALLHCLHSLRQELGIHVYAAHFNHTLRGAESDDDEAFVRNFCHLHQIELTVGRGNTVAQIISSDDSTEEAARRLRYAFLDELTGYVATAHTADDNLETFLINLLRGSSLAGLGGIPPQRGHYVRPMLNVSRDEVLRYLNDNALPHREDSSNASDAYLRNRLRHYVLPPLKAENPALLRSVYALTDRLRQDETLLQAQAQTALRAAQKGDGWLCSLLRAEPEPILHRVAISLLHHIPDRTSHHVDALCALIRTSHPSAQLNLPGGCIARREYDLLLFSSASHNPIPTTVLSIPGVNRAGRWQLECTLVPQRTGSFCIPYRANARYFVRARQTGDRLHLAGGTKTLKALMIDRKIPAVQRDSLPVLCDENGPIALLGVAADLEKISGESKIYLSISLKEIFD